jgi:hypothetical protein
MYTTFRDYALVLQFCNGLLTAPVNVLLQEKLKQQAYVSPEDFAYDFSQLFGNVTTYYPESSPAYSKAHELSALFDTRWKEVQAKFR